MPPVPFHPGFGECKIGATGVALSSVTGGGFSERSVNPLLRAGYLPGMDVPPAARCRFILSRTCSSYRTGAPARSGVSAG